MEPRELSERKKQILKAIVDAHIEGGEPVGSKAVLQNRQLNCSSATVRNEMAELEEMGYLEQPHASAGRIPSEQGYRFYVNSLLEHYAMTAGEIAQINRLLRAKMEELDQILTAASNLASALTNYTGFAVRPKLGSVTVTKYETIFLEPDHFILVAVMSTGSVRTKHISPAAPVTAESVATLAEVLNRYFIGLTADRITLSTIMEMENELGPDSAIAVQTIKVVYDLLREADEGEMKISGINHLLQYPEYSDRGKFQELLGALEKKEDILDLVSRNQANDDISVLIGSESRVDVMNNSALVFKPIVKDGKTLGAIGVLGPRRMDYAKVLATLQGLSGNIEDIIQSKKQTSEGENSDG